MNVYESEGFMRVYEYFKGSMRVDGVRERLSCRIR